MDILLLRVSVPSFLPSLTGADATPALCQAWGRPWGFGGNRTDGDKLHFQLAKAKGAVLREAATNWTVGKGSGPQLAQGLGCCQLPPLPQCLPSSFPPYFCLSLQLSSPTQIGFSAL